MNRLIFLCVILLSACAPQKKFYFIHKVGRDYIVKEIYDVYISSHGDIQYRGQDWR